MCANLPRQLSRFVCSAARSLRTPDGAHLAAGAAAAIQRLAAIGLHAGDAGARGHVELIEHLARCGIDAPDVADIVLQGAVPELAIDPGDAGDEARAGDAAQDLARRRID